MAKSGKGPDRGGGGKDGAKGGAKGKGGEKGKGKGKKGRGGDEAAPPRAPRASILERLALLVAVLFVLALAVQQLPA